MTELFKTKIGRLRIVALLEGISLLILVLIAVPVKYVFNNPIISEVVGPIHGALFLLYVFYTLSVAVMLKWKFMTTTWKVLLASFIPFGTFYVDKTILSKSQLTENTAE